MKENSKHDSSRGKIISSANKTSCFISICNIQNAIVIVLTMMLIFVYSDWSNAESPAFKRIIKEQSIAIINPSTFISESFVVSPDGKRVAYIEKAGNKAAVVLDGIRKKSYDEIIVPGFGFDFSPDSSKFGFFARENKDWFLVMDGQEQKEHRLNVKSFLLMGELTYSITGRVSYSKEEAHYCYAADDGDKQYLVVDGKAVGNKYDQVFACEFSHDGKRIVHLAREKQGGKVFYVIDGVKQKEYGIAKSFDFSPDGKRYAYIAYPTKTLTKRGQPEFIVLDGREENEKDYWRVSRVTFSPDSKRTAYNAEPDTFFQSNSVMVMDGQEINNGTNFAGFSPDGKRIVYSAILPGKKLFRTNEPPSHAYYIIDGKPGKPYERLSIPVFSPDSSRIAYYGVAQKKYIMVVDNKEGKPYDDIGHPVFSPDSKRVAYWARQRVYGFIVADGKEYNQYEGFFNPVFSPDSKRVCYVAGKFDKKTVVLDNVEGQFYDEIYPRHWRKKVAHTGIGFSSDKSFYYFARKGNELIFVHETIESPD